MNKKYIIDNEELMNEWHWEKNKVLYLDPKTLTYGVTKKAWWKCDKGHEWLAQISHRTKGSGCPYCSGRYAIKGENDLQTINPTLAKEWNYEKNNELTPDNVMPNSGKKVWWKCNKGHEWQAVIGSRNRGLGCPICNSERNTSLPENHGLSNKMKQIHQNPWVAIAGDWFTANEQGINLGYFGDKENKKIAEKMLVIFSEWINNGHNNFEDKNTCILQIELTDGVLFSQGTRYDIDFTK